MVYVIKEKESSTLAGADHVFYILKWHSKVLEITNGTGVNVVYESVGSTLRKVLTLLKLVVLLYFTEWPAVILPVDPRMLMDTSKTLTGGDLWNVLTTFEERKKRSTQLFDWIASGKLNIASPTIFSLQDGARAHELLESRKSTGKILLIPYIHKKEARFLSSFYFIYGFLYFHTFPFAT